MGRKPRKNHLTNWWAPQAVPEGQCLSAEIGPLSLSLARLAGEWDLISSQGPESDAVEESRLRIEPCKGFDDQTVERFVHAGTTDRVILQPVLADRPVVIRPRQPLALLGGQKITLYLSTPVFIRLLIGEDETVMLKELPTVKLSDTWFGPSTREGEVCYAGRTQARHDLAELPRRSHRAVTPLEVHNQSNIPLALDKISVPVPMLALFGSERAGLWTQRLVLEATGQADMASIRIESQAPEVDGAMVRLAEPRQTSTRSGLIRAFSHLLGD